MTILQNAYFVLNVHFFFFLYLTLFPSPAPSPSFLEWSYIGTGSVLF